jgi:hypothetical protein
MAIFGLGQRNGNFTLTGKKFSTKDYDGQIKLEHNETITINGNGAVLDSHGGSRFFYLAKGFTGSLALESITLQNADPADSVSRTMNCHLTLAEHQLLLAIVKRFG